MMQGLFGAPKPELKPTILSRAYGIGHDSPKFSWVHFIEPFSNFVLIQAIVQKPDQIGSVTVGRVEAFRLGALDDPITPWRTEDWGLFDPPKGQRVLEATIEGSGEFSNCQTASTTASGVGRARSEVIWNEEEAKSLLSESTEVERDWISLGFQERGLRGVHESRPVLLVRPSLVKTFENFLFVRTPTASGKKMAEAVIEAFRLFKISRLLEVYEAWRAKRASE